ncbi:unnamed protein product [Caenorhabditis auriculariae]|uniref:Uncharacterized protein n=1 Tax=Caenorhabditis auriculariae TaxID=2777116 RepID=A0A8S1H2T9_9PELO|nr:unnamed protein product [Caenorhabditis auriculariae]
MLYVSTSKSAYPTDTLIVLNEIKQESPTLLQLTTPHSPSAISNLLRANSSLTSEKCFACHNYCCEEVHAFVDGHLYHTTCLQCNLCKFPLGFEETCFVRDGLILCRTDYYSKYGKKCAKCQGILQKDDVVMRARDATFHVLCFSCHVCGSMLQVGDLFTMTPQMQLCCHAHSDAICDEARLVEREREANSEEPEEYVDDEQPVHNRSKRMRTSFKHHQLRTMKQYFNLNHNPDAKDLKQLAQKTGLTKRVLQVWFQNARAKFRRSMQQQDGNTLSPTTLSQLSSLELKNQTSSSSNQSSDYISTSPDRVRDFYEATAMGTLASL